MNKRAHILISGRVHGVGFRMYAVERAEELQVAGWVKNREDGKVEIMCEGEEDNVEAFVQWCRTGPDSADVNGVKTVYLEPTGEFDSFHIRYGSG